MIFWNFISTYIMTIRKHAYERAIKLKCFQTNTASKNQTKSKLLGYIDSFLKSK